MMPSGFTYLRNQSSAPVDEITHGNDGYASSAHSSLLIERLGWPVAVAAIVVQQGAFVSSPVLSKFVTAVGSPDAQANILNTLAVFLNIVLIAPFCLLHFRRFVTVISGNKLASALLVLMFLSVTWSIHPDVTFRRDVNYFSTILTACYLAQQFDIDEIMRILSWGIAISVVFSFLFVAAFPIDAIHQPSPWHGEGGDIAGDWKGVFSHKNNLGHVMIVGIFVELYMLTATSQPIGRLFWHTILLGGCIVLCIFSHSGTALILASIYLVGAILFLLLQHARKYFGVGLATLAIVVATIIFILFVYPDLLFGFLGRDETLTGRTELWALVLRFIWDRPLLGWGYSAMWLPDDDITRAISDAVGWDVPEAHNALLDVTLQMGIVGLVIVLSFIVVSIWRAMRCVLVGDYKLGMYSLIFFLGVNISGITESTLAQNQSIEWVVFNVLSFCCGLTLMRGQRADGGTYYNPTFDIASHPPVSTGSA